MTTTAKPLSGATKGFTSTKDIKLASQKKPEMKMNFHMVGKDNSMGTVGIKTGSTYDDTKHQEQTP